MVVYNLRVEKERGKGKGGQEKGREREREREGGEGLQMHQVFLSKWLPVEGTKDVLWACWWTQHFNSDAPEWFGLNLQLMALL